MSFSIAIVGLPNAGKSSLFKALTKIKVDIASYPFTTIDPNIGVVPVPDKRLEKISLLVGPEKTINATLEFVDIAGLVKNANKGEGMGNQFLSNIKACDAIVEVVRDFKDPNVSHTEGEINPELDIEIIKNELIMKDLEIIEKNISISNPKETGKLNLFKKIRNCLMENNPITLTDKEKSEIKEYQFLTNKPKIYLFNTDKEKENLENKKISINLKNEEEMSLLSRTEKEELKMTSWLDQLITACYNALELITFFTIAKKREAKAWTIKNKSSALDAAEKVHTDFKENFKRAEVINWQEFINSGSWLKAKELGKIKTVSKDYIVSDGDIIEFKI